MRCLECGYDNEEGSAFCSNCGSTLSSQTPTKEEPQKRGKSKKRTSPLMIAAVATIIIIVGIVSYISLFSYDIQEANDLVEQANREIQNGNTLLTSSVRGKIAEYRKITFDLDTESELQNEIQYAKTTSQSAQQLTGTVTTIKGHFNNARNYFSQTHNLRLPAWYHDYIDLKIKAIDKDLERMSKIEELINNYILYYGFAEKYLQGRDELLTLMDALENGLEDVESGDFSSGASAFQTALSQLRESTVQFEDASTIISLDSLDELLDQMEHIDTALESLSDATQFLSSGDISQAMSLLALANDELAGVEKAPTALLEDQIDSWYETHILGLLTEIEHLLTQVTQYEQDAQELYDQHT